MTQEERQLLLKDICARLPYGVKTGRHNCYDKNKMEVNVLKDILTSYEDLINIIDNLHLKPYLRPMSSMTEEEYNELKEFESYYGIPPIEVIDDWAPNYEVIDWLNEHHFDYRGLIGKGLALPAPEGMYND